MAKRKRIMTNNRAEPLGSDGRALSITDPLLDSPLK
jgi:hypothetical protein